MSTDPGGSRWSRGAIQVQDLPEDMEEWPGSGWSTGRRVPAPVGGEGRAAHGQDWSSPDPWMGSRVLSVSGQGQGQCQGNCAHSSGGPEGGHQIPPPIQQTSQQPQHTYTAGWATQPWTKTRERSSQPTRLVPAETTLAPLPPLLWLHTSLP